MSAEHPAALQRFDDRPDRALAARFYALMMLDRVLWRGPHKESPRFAAKQALVEEMLARSPFSRPIAPAPLLELQAEGLTAEAFWAASRQLHRPVVIRGFARDTRAVQGWTPEALSARIGHQVCTVAHYDEDSLREPWNRGVDVLRMDFNTYLARMRDERLYISNSTEVVANCPGLVDDLELERIRAAFGRPGTTWDELVGTNVFISSAKVSTSIHHAMGGNFFLQIAGRKTWTLMDPRYTAYIHPVNGRPFQYCNSAYGGYRVGAYNGLGDDNPLLWLPRFEVTLEPGDLLYNAPWWWHEVENLDPFVVGCAVRHIPQPGRASPGWANHPLFTLTSLYPAARAATFAHYLRQRLTGDTRSMREWFNKVQMKALYKSFSVTRGGES